MFRCRIYPYYAETASIQTVYFPPELVDEVFDASYFMFRGINDIQFVNIICNDSEEWEETHFALAWWERPPTSDEHVITCNNPFIPCSDSPSRRRFCTQCGKKNHLPRRGCSPKYAEHQIFCSQCGRISNKCVVCGPSCKILDVYQILRKVHIQDMQNNSNPAGGEKLLRIINAENVFSHRAMIHWIAEQCPCKDTDSRTHHPCNEFVPTCFYCILRGRVE